MKKETIVNIFSIGTTFVFSFYNLYLGLAKSSPWNLSIFVYYVVLLIIKVIAYLLFLKEEKDSGGENFYPFLLLSILEIFLVVSFFGPSYLMYCNKREVSLTMIDGISVATYTFVKVGLAIRNFMKGKQHANCFKVVRFCLGIIDAFSSLLTLQNTLILINAKENAAFMLSFSMISSVVVLALLVVFLVGVSFTKLRQMKKSN